MGFVKYHQPCLECGGSDPVSINDNGTAICFNCRKWYKNYEAETKNVVSLQETKTNMRMGSSGEFNALTDRNISATTAKKYGVKSVLADGKIVKHSYPYFIANEIAGYKVREPNKIFIWQGTSKGTGLFGEQLFQNKGKYITVTEGECDAMAAYELLGSKWPVVSLKNGAGGAPQDFKNSLEFLENFDNVVINFDNDTPGREAARKVAKLLTPGKAKILYMPDEYKDANDMLKQSQQNLYVTAWWAAKTYTPSGVMNLSDNLEKLKNRERKECVPYPWEGLNKKLYGMRQGELITLTGGTGLGKSSITRELEHHLIAHTKDKVGILALEEDWTRTADGLLSIEANTRLYIDEERDAYGQDKYSELSEEYLNGKNKDRVWIHAHFGANDFEDIISKLRYMIIGCGCRWVVVDHLHMLLSSLTAGDERTGIDNIMMRLRKLVEETGAGMVLVSHLRRVEGNRGHENGITVSLNHLRGSQSIAQLSDCVIALERDQQAEDPQEANTTHLRVLKSRYTGDVGLASHLLYDKTTGRLHEVEINEEDFEEII